MTSRFFKSTVPIHLKRAPREQIFNQFPVVEPVQSPRMCTSEEVAAWVRIACYKRRIKDKDELFRIFYILAPEMMAMTRPEMEEWGEKLLDEVIMGVRK